jgi:hypothetical protein
MAASSQQLASRSGRSATQIGPRNGTIHDVMLLNPIASTPPVRGVVDQASEYQREVFAD